MIRMAITCAMLAFAARGTLAAEAIEPAAADRALAAVVRFEARLAAMTVAERAGLGLKTVTKANRIAAIRSTSSLAARPNRAARSPASQLASAPSAAARPGWMRRCPAPGG